MCLSLLYFILLEERCPQRCCCSHYYTSTRQLVFVCAWSSLFIWCRLRVCLLHFFLFLFYHWLAATARVLTPVHGVCILVHAILHKELLYKPLPVFILFCAAALFVTLSRDYVSVTNTATAGKRWPLRILGPPPRSLFTRPFCRFRFCYVRNYPFVTAK